MESSTPPDVVLRAFRLRGKPVLLQGGQGDSFVLEGLVLKPTFDPVETEWLCNLQIQLIQKTNTNYRIAQPIAVPDTDPSQFVAHGWTATKFIAGQPSFVIRPRELLAASRPMHDDLRNLVLDPPEWLSRRDHRWAWGDKVAWQEIDLHDVPNVETEGQHIIRPMLARLIALLQPLNATAVHNQLVHGDMTGNMLYSSELPTAIIDFSPFWRPVECAEAIVVADGIIWHGEAEDIVRTVGLSSFRLQMLVRAMIFRLATSLIQSNLAYVQANVRGGDVEKAIQLLERLWAVEAEK